jgi:hypothetical protein
VYRKSTTVNVRTDWRKIARGEETKKALRWSCVGRRFSNADDRSILDANSVLRKRKRPV